MLREEALRAVHAEHTILSSMVIFECRICVERFATFHPAYDPSDQIDLTCMKRGQKGVAVCSIAVASWDGEPPPFKESEEDSLVAKRYEGVCLRCKVDLDHEEKTREVPIPKFSRMNYMDPCWYTLPEEIQQIFDCATVSEECLFCLEHMSVNVHRVMKVGGLSRFLKNCISFPQDIATWFARAGLLRPFREGDAVNSVRGPRGDVRDAMREPVLAASASEEDRRRYATNERAELVFPGRVMKILGDGRILVAYSLDWKLCLVLPHKRTQLEIILTK